MNIIETNIEGVIIIEPRLFEDERGYFFESFNQKEFQEKVCKTTFIQDNESKSCFGVLRGLHFQKPPFAQSKLVRVVKGAVLDQCLYKYLKTNLPQPNIDITLRHKIFGPFSR